MTSRVPTAIKKIRGNPGKRRLNDREPQPDAQMPQMPKHLTGPARSEWRRVARRLHVAGVLTYVDRGVLAVYCHAYGRWVEAEEALERGGPVIETTNGNMVQSPWLQISNRAQETMIKAAKELGMTPAARTSIKVAEKPVASLADLLFEEAAR